MSREGFAAILLAGGSGSRLKEVTRDKTLLRIGSWGTVVRWNLNVFLQAGIFQELVIVTRDEAQRAAIEAELAGIPLGHTRVHWAQGGARRQDSVFNGLEALPEDTGWVAVHDVARPFVTAQDLVRLKQAVLEDGAAALARPVTDTIKQADHEGETRNLNLRDLQRPLLWAMETPQVFRYAAILDAYRSVQHSGAVVTDCVGAYAMSGGRVSLLESSQPNFKITRPVDVEWANFLINKGVIQAPDASA